MPSCSGIRCVKETGAFLVTTALSCGPSQLFGCIKLIVDTCLILVSKSKEIAINSNLNEIENNWKIFKTSSAARLVEKKLAVQIDELTEIQAKNYFETKDKKIKEKIKKLTRSIRADASALLPLVGAHISWRIATEYRGKNFTPIFSRAVQQLFEHSKTIASLPLFLGRTSKAANKLEEGNSSAEEREYTIRNIEVRTSTKTRSIRLYHQVANGKEGANRTVVLFHPNSSENHPAQEMHEKAWGYRLKGYNTLAVTLGGYQGSPGVTTSEKSMYQDIEAVKTFLNEQGVTEVAYHGFSLGSGAALQAATGKSNINLKTLFVVLDQPYTSAAEAGNNIAGPLGKGLMTAACPVGLQVELPGGLTAVTDGLNNLKKVEKIKEKSIRLMCIEGNQDFLMGREKKGGKYTKNFAQDLLKVRYEEGSKEYIENLMTFNQSHGANSLDCAYGSNPVSKEGTWLSYLPGAANSQISDIDDTIKIATA